MKSFAASLALLLLFNTAIAALLTVIEFGEGFWINLLFSQCIGFSITLINVPLILRSAPSWKRGVMLLPALPFSVVLGIVLGHVLLGRPFALSHQVWQTFAIGMMFAVLGSVMFLLAERIYRLDNEVRQRRLIEAEQGRRETEAHLKLLQAQIEPHFLFNTLANVGSLIDSDPPRARELLDRLNDWLRAALARTRSPQASLGDELALLENWLKILAVRFGPRLAWQFDADADCRALPFPPMLLQPLLENAVKHGIEPKLGGGRLSVHAQRRGNRLRIEVGDDGVGLTDNSTPTGTGLSNIRARLQALFGDAARLELNANPHGGVCAVLELPCAH